MVLHSKLTVIKNGKAVAVFNDLLMPIKEALMGLMPYSENVVIGRSTKPTIENQERLFDAAWVEPLGDGEFNFNPLNGELYIKKVLVFDEKNTLNMEIGELGLTAWPEESNPKVVNRYYFDEPIFKDAGEEMTFEFVIYLTNAWQGKNIVMTGGSNPLIASILGKSVLGGGIDSFYLSKSNNETPTETTIERENLNYNYPCETSIGINEKGEVCINLKSNLGGESVVELLVIYAGKVVMRSYVKEGFGVVEGLSKVCHGDADNCCLVNAGGVLSVERVENAETGESLEFYELSPVASGFKKVIENPFGEKHFPYGYSYEASSNGKQIYFYNKETNENYFYTIDGESIITINTIWVSCKDLIKCKVITDSIFRRFWDANNNRYDMTVYFIIRGQQMFHNGTMFGTPMQVYDANKILPWNDFHIAECKDKTYRLLAILVDTGLEVYRLYEDNSAHYKKDGTFSFNCTGIKYLLADATERSEARLIGYSDKTNTCITMSYEDKQFVEVTAPMVREIFFDEDADEGFPKFQNNNLVTYSSKTGKMKVFNIVTGEEKVIEFSGVKKIYFNTGLDYMATRKDDESLEFFYVDGSFNFYPFSSGLIGGIKDEDVLHLELLFDHALLFMKDGTNKLAMFNRDRVVLGGIDYGSEVRVTYSGDTSPGASGSVRAEVKINLGVNLK